MSSKKKPEINTDREFYICNRDALFYSGLYAGDILWSNDIKDARTFTEDSKVTSLKRWKPEEDIQIIYI